MRLVVFGLAVLLAALDVVAGSIKIETLPTLPRPVSNNAVALVSTAQGDYLYSFLGLGSGKTWQDISSGAAVLNPGATTWTELEPVPGAEGRLAASAVSAAGAAWLFGGYTVAEDGSEKSYEVMAKAEIKTLSM